VGLPRYLSPASGKKPPRRSKAGVSWLPYGLDRMDEEYEDRYYPLGLSMKLGELWRQQGHSTYQARALGGEDDFR
jgi:hypothetical protein